MIYTGIGSRKTPELIIKQMVWLGEVMAVRDYVLRSGGAAGADVAFEEGCDNIGGLKEIYLPYKRFNKSDSPLFEIPKRAYDLARIYHPSYFGLQTSGKKFMARNVQQILGETTQPTIDKVCQLVICWTPDGCSDGTNTSKDTGGTGQALRIAADYNIPIFNLENEDALDRLTNFLNDV